MPPTRLRWIAASAYAPGLHAALLIGIRHRHDPFLRAHLRRSFHLLAVVFIPFFAIFASLVTADSLRSTDTLGIGLMAAALVWQAWLMWLGPHFALAAAAALAGAPPSRATRWRDLRDDSTAPAAGLAPWIWSMTFGGSGAISVPVVLWRWHRHDATTVRAIRAGAASTVATTVCILVWFVVAVGVHPLAGLAAFVVTAATTWALSRRPARAALVRAVRANEGRSAAPEVDRWPPG